MTEAQSMLAFFGYVEVELTRPVNDQKRVKVKCLPVRRLPEYAALFTIEPELIGLCTDLSPEEIDMLSPNDSGMLFDKAHEINFDPFSAWLKRKAKAAKMQAQCYGIGLPESESKDNGESSAS